MRAALPLALLAACSINAGGNHRLVGAVDSPIADAASLKSVTVSNIAGAVTVRAAGQSKASIRADVLLDEDRPESDFVPDFAEHVEVLRQADRLMIRNRHGSDSDHNDWNLRFEISLPAGVSLEIEQVAGMVDVQLPSAGDVAINNTAGTVELAIGTIDGKLEATAQSGTIDIVIAGSGPANGCDIDCTTGTVMLQLPENIDGDFDLGATAGDVNIAGRYGLDVKRAIASVRARGTVGQGGRNFRIHAVTGSIELR